MSPYAAVIIGGLGGSGLLDLSTWINAGYLICLPALGALAHWLYVNRKRK